MERRSKTGKSAFCANQAGDIPHLLKPISVAVSVNLEKLLGARDVPLTPEYSDPMVKFVLSVPKKSMRMPYRNMKKLSACILLLKVVSFVQGILR